MGLPSYPEVLASSCPYCHQPFEAKNASKVDLYLRWKCPCGRFIRLSAPVDPYDSSTQTACRCQTLPHTG